MGFLPPSDTRIIITVHEKGVENQGGGVVENVGLLMVMMCGIKAKRWSHRKGK